MNKLPAIVGDTWFNSHPLSRTDLRGRVSLVSFWNYSNIDSLRYLSHLKHWRHSYKDKGLLIIGIHTPEFDFEKQKINVEMMMQELDIDWPVVLDNNYVNWNNFGNRYFQTVYLADKNGRIVYEHLGEDGHKEAEQAIQYLLKDKPERIKSIKLGTSGESPVEVCFIPTPKLYCGYVNGILDNAGGYFYDQAAEYTPPSVLTTDSLALKGKFIAKPDYVETLEPGSSVLLQFMASEVNLVLEPVGGESEARVLLNGITIPENVSGAHVRKEGMVDVSIPRLYHLLQSGYIVEGVLSVEALKNNFRAYVFTFSGCV
jgi:hypothetical protein